METTAHSETLTDAFRDHIGSDNVRAAFDELAAGAATAGGIRCETRWKGVVRDFRLYDAVSGEQPFAVIVNKASLLFYVRQPGLARLPGGTAQLAALLPDVSENRRGEIKIRLTTTDDVRRLLGYLFPGPRAH